MLRVLLASPSGPSTPVTDWTIPLYTHFTLFVKQFSSRLYQRYLRRVSAVSRPPGTRGTPPGTEPALADTRNIDVHSSCLHVRVSDRPKEGSEM